MWAILGAVLCNTVLDDRNGSGNVKEQTVSRESGSCYHRSCVLLRTCLGSCYRTTVHVSSYYMYFGGFVFVPRHFPGDWRVNS